MLGYTCELEIKHYYRTFPSTHAHYNSYSRNVIKTPFMEYGGLCDLVTPAIIGSVPEVM